MNSPAPSSLSVAALLSLIERQAEGAAATSESIGAIHALLMSLDQRLSEVERSVGRLSDQLGMVVTLVTSRPFWSGIAIGVACGIAGAAAAAGHVPFGGGQ